MHQPAKTSWREYSKNGFVATIAPQVSSCGSLGKFEITSSDMILDTINKNTNLLIKAGEKLLTYKPANSSALRLMEKGINKWLEDCRQSYVNTLPSDYARSFTATLKNCSLGAMIPVGARVIGFAEKVKTLRLEIQKRILTLRENLQLIKIADEITDPDKITNEKRADYSVTSRMELILRKLYELKEGDFVSVNFILRANGIKTSRLSIKDMISELIDEGLVRMKISSENPKIIKARITIKGQKKIESYLNRTEITDPTKKGNKPDSVMKEEKSKPGKIFISHSSKNKEVVNKFCDLILHNGLNINVSQDVFNTSLEGSKPRTGEDFRNRIKQEIINAKIVLQFISKDYKRSEVCLNEMGAAWVLSENVVPLIIEKDEYEVGFIHSTTQQVQLHKEADIFRLTDELREKGIFSGIIKTERLAAKVREFVLWMSNKTSDQAIASAGNDAKAEKLIWLERFNGPGSWRFNYWTPDEPDETTHNRIQNGIMLLHGTKENIINKKGEFGAHVDIAELENGKTYEIRCKVRSIKNTTMGFQLWVHDGQTDRNSKRKPLTLKTPSHKYYETIKLDYTVNESNSMRIHLHCKAGSGQIEVCEVSIYEKPGTKSSAALTTNVPSESDLKMIVNYMDSKKFTKMKMESLCKFIHPKFTEGYVLKLIEAFPEDITRTMIKGKSGIQNLLPDFNVY